MITIVPAAQGWHVCALNSKGNDFDYHPVIAWHVYEGDLPPTPVLAWGTHRPDPYALHFEPNDSYYLRGNSWRIVRKYGEALKLFIADVEPIPF